MAKQSFDYEENEMIRKNKKNGVDGFVFIYFSFLFPLSVLKAFGISPIALSSFKS